MLFRSYTPSAPLCAFIEDFWMYDGYAGAHQRERILPSGTFELVFNLREDELRIYGPTPHDGCRRFPGAAISGPYAGSFMSDTAEEASIMGVHFRPGGAHALLGLPAGELANRHVALDAIWGDAAGELRERLCEARTATRRFRLLEEAIWTRLADPPMHHGAVGRALALITASHGRTKVRDIARTVDLSQRRLIELFTNTVGLTPKLYGRVRRFQHVLTLAGDPAEADWAALAAQCGYFDQSHLIRDFVEFSGVSPGDYRRRQIRLAQAGAHLKRNHLPL